MNARWVALAGHVEIKGDELVYSPRPNAMAPPDALVQANPTAALPPHAVVRSNIEFESGDIRLAFKIRDPVGMLQLVLHNNESFPLYAGINIMGARYGFGIFRNGIWERLAGTGYGSEIELDMWHELRLSAHGSNIDLYFNTVKVSSIQQQLQKAALSIYFQSHNKVEVRAIRVEPRKPVCFVVMQFTEDYNTLYSEVIEPTCQAYGYSVVRADDLYTSGLIIDDITQSIREATIVIADVTPNNANVFYEVGYSHGIGKPTILLSDRKREKLPFDISGFRMLFYDNTIGGKRAVESRLEKHLDYIAPKSTPPLPEPAPR
jgi:hypothetical protein